jgi:predicted nucleic acid-binding protein
MIRVVLDTSVAIAWYLPEIFSVSARAWQTRLLDGQVSFVTPTLHYWEFANVLRTNVRAGDLSRELAADIWALHLDAPIEISEPSFASVLDAALAHDATAYDAVYIALSLELDIPLLTAERRSTLWVKKLGKRIQSVVD